MLKKILIKYILFFLPVIFGIILFSNRIVNLFSSLLLFLGGYIAIKNTFDYRKLRKNISNVKKDFVLINKNTDKEDNIEKIPSLNIDNGIRNNYKKRYVRVRKKD